MVRDEDLGKIVQCPGCKQQLQTQAPPTQIPAPSKTNTPKTTPPAPPKSNPGSGPRPGTQPLSGTKPNPGKPSTPSSASVKSLPKKGAPSRNEDEEDSSESDDEDTGTGKTSRKNRIWMGWNNAYRGLNLASVGMVVYLVGLLLGGLGWVGYFFTRQDALFFAAAATSHLDGGADLFQNKINSFSTAFATRRVLPF